MLKGLQDHPNLLKNVYIYTHIHLPKKKKHILTTIIKMLSTLTWESHEFGFNKNKSNATLKTFSQ